MRIFFLLSLILFTGCYAVKDMDFSMSFWGELQSAETYLYTADSLTAIVDKELKRGSVLFFYKSKGNFYEVYTKNPKKIKDVNYRNKFRYYVYKPTYKKVKYYSSEPKVYVLPFDPNREYFTGERGGCYYINKNGNKTYVARGYCKYYSKPKPQNNSPKTNSRTKRKNCGTVQCSGRTKKGSRCRNKTTSCSGRCHLH